LKPEKRVPVPPFPSGFWISDYVRRGDIQILNRTASIAKPGLRRRSAKPLITGSNPVARSNFFRANAETITSVRAFELNTQKAAGSIPAVGESRHSSAIQIVSKFVALPALRKRDEKVAITVC
jgi:hypothetical protein